jgi:quinol monooxygenase YgiN
MNDPIIIVARFTAHSGQEALLRGLLVDVVQKTQQEPGCERFEIHEALSAPGEFTLVERFVNQSAFDAHMQADHTQRYFERARSLLDGAITATRLRRFA